MKQIQALLYKPLGEQGHNINLICCCDAFDWKKTF